MLSNAQSKYIRSLTQLKYRKQDKVFIAEGDKIAKEWLSSAAPVQMIVATQDWADAHHPLIKAHHEAELCIVTEQELEKVSALQTAHKALLVVPMPEAEQKIPDTGWCIALEQVQDPGNLGAILRIADWFAIPQVFCSPGSVDVYNPKVVQASMGAFLRVDSQEIELETLLHRQPELPVLGAVLNGDDLFAAPLPSSGILVVGNESKGIRPDTQRQLSHRIAIPRAPGGGAESLNAAVATGIITAFWVNRTSS